VAVAGKCLGTDERPTQPYAIDDSLCVVESQAARGALDVDDVGRPTRRRRIAVHDSPSLR
jgi:hypothetical protein